MDRAAEIRIGEVASPSQWPEDAKEDRVNIEKLPFIHFMVRIEAGRESHLLTASEAEEGTGGQFFVPLGDDGDLFPVYRFHYSLYLGNGNYLENGADGKIFQGFGLT